MVIMGWVNLMPQSSEPLRLESAIYTWANSPNIQDYQLNASDTMSDEEYSEILNRILFYGKSPSRMSALRQYAYSLFKLSSGRYVFANSLINGTDDVHRLRYYSHALIFSEDDLRLMEWNPFLLDGKLHELTVKNKYSLSFTEEDYKVEIKEGVKELKKLRTKYRRYPQSEADKVSRLRILNYLMWEFLRSGGKRTHIVMRIGKERRENMNGQALNWAIEELFDLFAREDKKSSKKLFQLLAELGRGPVSPFFFSTGSYRDFEDYAIVVILEDEGKDTIIKSPLSYEEHISRMLEYKLRMKWKEDIKEGIRW